MALDKMGNYIPDGTDTGQFRASGGMTGGYADTNVGKPTPTYNGLQSVGQAPAPTAASPQIQWGQKVPDSYKGTDEYQPFANADVSKLNFGTPPVPGATPQINPFTGEFMGWQVNGQSLVPTASTQQGALMGNTYGPDMGGWSINQTGAHTAPEAFQHGPNNFMERLASKSPYIIGAMAAGGAGMAASGMTAAEASAAVSGGAASGAGTGLETLGTGAVAPTTSAGTGLVDAGTLAGSAGGTAGTGAAAANPYAIGAEELGAGMATPGSVAPVAGEGGAATAGIPGSTAANIGSMTQQASTMTQISDYMKKGMSFMEAIQKVMGGQAGGAAGGGTGGGAGGGGGGLMDLLGAYYSAQQQKDLAGNLKEPYSAMQGRQDPYNQLLLNSYQHPEQFYNSSTWKGLESVYQNSIDRGAAKGGTLANPTDRERLLQAYGMKELENYRNGLRGNVNAYDPTRLGEMYQKGLVAEAGANTAPFAAWAKAGGVQGVMNTVVNTASTAADIWKLIEGWFTDKP